jgi:hypothetical protein
VTGPAAKGRRPFDRFVSGFIAADPEQRAAALAWLIGGVGRGAVGVLADRLVRRLASATPESRIRLAEALASFGPGAVPTLSCALLKATGAKLESLAEAVGAVGEKLPEADRVDLQANLLLVTLRSRDPAAVAALVAAADRLRAASRRQG